MRFRWRGRLLRVRRRLEGASLFRWSDRHVAFHPFSSSLCSCGTEETYAFLPLGCPFMTPSCSFRPSHRLPSPHVPLVVVIFPRPHSTVQNVHTKTIYSYGTEATSPLASCNSLQASKILCFGRILVPRGPSLCYQQKDTLCTLYRHVLSLRIHQKASEVCSLLSLSFSSSPFFPLSRTLTYPNTPVFFSTYLSLVCCIHTMSILLALPLATRPHLDLFSR